MKGTMYAITESKKRLLDSEFIHLMNQFNKGYTNGFYGFTYLNPNYNATELQYWTNGFKKGQDDKMKGL